MFVPRAYPVYNLCLDEYKVRMQKSIVAIPQIYGRGLSSRGFTCPLEYIRSYIGLLCVDAHAVAKPRFLHDAHAVACGNEIAIRTLVRVALLQR